MRRANDERSEEVARQQQPGELERSEDQKQGPESTYGITGVGQGAEGLGLGADDGASADLGGAPVLAGGEGDRVGVDVVVGADGGDKGGSNGQDGELEGRHCDRSGGVSL